MNRSAPAALRHGVSALLAAVCVAAALTGDRTAGVPDRAPVTQRGAEVLCRVALSEARLPYRGTRFTALQGGGLAQVTRWSENGELRGTCAVTREAGELRAALFPRN